MLKQTGYTQAELERIYKEAEMSNEMKAQKKYNPTVTRFYEDFKWSQKDEEGNPIPNTAFVTGNIKPEEFAVVQRSLQPGCRLLLRLSPRLTSEGNKYYFFDILPPLSNQARFNQDKPQIASGTSSESNDI